MNQVEVPMCGQNVHPNRLQAAGILNELKGSEWIGVAEKLAHLSLEDFQLVLRAFKLYREANVMENRAELERTLFRRLRSGG
jgi:hypothetical protein